MLEAIVTFFLVICITQTYFWIKGALVYPIRAFSLRQCQVNGSRLTLWQAKTSC